MGSCACSEGNLARSQLFSVPEPRTYSDDQLIFVYYNETDRCLATYEDVSQLLTSNLVLEVKKLIILNETDDILKDLVYIKGINLSEVADQNAMLLELYGSKLLVQYGHISHMDKMLSYYRKRIKAQYKPAYKISMIRILELLLSKTDLSSTKEMMKLIKLTNG